MKSVLLFIAMRHLRRRWRTTLLTVGGVMLGVFAMSFMASMMLGLRQKFIDSITTAAPHVEVTGKRLWTAPQLFAVPAPAGENAPLTLLRATRPLPQRPEKRLKTYRQWIERLGRVDGVVAAAPQVKGKALLVYGSLTRTVNLWGITPDAQERVISVREHLRDAIGDLAQVPNGCYLGKEFLRRTGIPIGARVTLIGPKGTRRVVRVLARYHSGVRETDELICIVRLPLAQSLLGFGDEATSIALRVKDVYRAYDIARIAERLTGYQAQSWQEANANYFALFNLQDLVTALLLTATLVVAAFGIANGLITTVLQKQRDIGILKALGLTATDIAGLFVLEGLLTGALGALLAIPLAMKAIDFMSRVPIVGEGVMTLETFYMLRHPAVYWVPALIGVLVSAIAAVFPARLAARYDPVDIIRSASV
ncbi:Lipoprotein-releasing system transmembrane protein LolE [bacterium HR17]|uniref:Lipoprotein-releasing system transmembrane protein LolE n=1 Tax=Candidatus Fervidibacter japonicus TaxID=2035412 RepID=A0A2H5XG30_9BACT|nr:Lipoprotein-releasing system transmembrane protein LolE [bacterium HR17]